MSTTGRRDDDGAAGESLDSRFQWKDGFNLAVGIIPVNLLLQPHGVTGPWRIVREAKGMISVRRVAAPETTRVDVEKCPIAWRGKMMDHTSALMLCERFNGYETARDFPPKALA